MSEFNIKTFYDKKNVLNKGFIELIDGPAEDPKTKIVNAARVSFLKEVQELKPRDLKLVQYLLDHGHFSTMRHSYFSFRIKAPLFVLRQAWKYQVGSHWEEDGDIGSVVIPGDGAWAEASGRYVKFDPEFYLPDIVRVQSKDNKQGSSGKLEELPNGDDPVLFFKKRCVEQYEAYKYMVDAGAAKEQCRALLPQGLYTQCIWTLSLQAIMFFLSQRLKSDAQYEIRSYAIAIKEMIQPIFEPLKLFSD